MGIFFKPPAGSWVWPWKAVTPPRHWWEEVPPLFRLHAHAWIFVPVPGVASGKLHWLKEIQTEIHFIAAFIPIFMDVFTCIISWDSLAYIYIYIFLIINIQMVDHLKIFKWTCETASSFHHQSISLMAAILHPNCIWATKKWLFNGDPVLAYYNPHISGQYSPLYTPKKHVFFIVHLNWFIHLN